MKWTCWRDIGMKMDCREWDRSPRPLHYMWSALTTELSCQAHFQVPRGAILTTIRIGLRYVGMVWWRDLWGLENVPDKIAQWLEHSTCNGEVVGSYPTLGSPFSCQCPFNMSASWRLLYWGSPLQTRINQISLRSNLHTIIYRVSPPNHTHIPQTYTSWPPVRNWVIICIFNGI